MRLKQPKTLFLIAFCFSILTIGSFFANNATLTPAEGTPHIRVFINNNEINFEQEQMPRPFINNTDRTLVPIRVVSEKMGFNVEWSDEINGAVVSKDGISMEVPIGKSTAKVNGKEVPIDLREINGVNVPVDTKAVIWQERTYVPLRFIAEYYGWTLNVLFNNGEMNIYLSEGGQPSVPPVESPVELPTVPEVPGTATNDSEANIVALRVLPFNHTNKSNQYNGLDIDGKTVMSIARYDGYEEITLWNWYVEGVNRNEKLKIIPPMVKEIFKFYFPNDYMKLYNLVDGAYHNTVPDDQIVGTHEFDGRKVEILDYGYQGIIRIYPKK